MNIENQILIINFSQIAETELNEITLKGEHTGFYIRLYIWRFYGWFGWLGFMAYQPL